MATIAAVNQVGETVVKLLNDRRALLAAVNQLGDLPPAVEITHTPISRIVKDPEPTAGLTFMLYRIEPSEFQGQQISGREPNRPSVLGVDLLFLLTAWSPTAVEEDAMMAWAMLQLHRYPLLDRTLLTGAGVWRPDEAVQLTHERVTDDTLFQLWQGMERRYRLSTAYRARVVRLEDADGVSTWPPVVTRRLGYANADRVAAGVLP